MRNFFRPGALLASLIVLTFCSTTCVFAADNDFLLGNWTITGNDLFGTDPTKFELDLTGAESGQYVIVRPFLGNEFSVTTVKTSGSGDCVYGKSFQIGRISPVSGSPATTVNTISNYYVANHCDIGSVTGREVEQVISNIAANKRSFTMCWSSDSSKCSTWTRVGKQPKLAKACSSKLLPPQPKVVLTPYDSTFKIASIDLGFGNPGTIGYEFEITPSKIPAGSTAEKIVLVTNTPFVSTGLRAATWKIKYKESCGTDPESGSTGTSKFSKSFVVKVKN